MIDAQSKVLVVDDFEMTRFMLKEALSHYKITDVAEARSGRRAWDALDKAEKSGKPFTIVFLDWNMPDMNGYDLLIKCRADPRFKTLEIVMVTASRERQDALKALKAGASGYIAKPFSIEDLIERIGGMNSSENGEAGGTGI